MRSDDGTADKPTSGLTVVNLRMVASTDEPVQRVPHRFTPFIDLEWFGRVAALPGKASLLVAVALQFEAAVQRQRTVVLTNHLLSEWAVDRSAKRRALAALEKAGLVSVKRRPRNAPKITLLGERPQFFKQTRRMQQASLRDREPECMA